MILIRHGQTPFNVHFAATRIDPGIPDPVLTDTGRVQAAEAAEALRGRGLERLVTSPYRRTLETATIIARALDLPVTVEPLVRERAAFVCDTGTLRAELAELWPQYDFAHLEDCWWRGLDETEAELIARCGRFRMAMAEVEDWRRVGVVTHWGVIKALTGQTVGNGAIVPYDPTAPHPAPPAI